MADLSKPKLQLRSTGSFNGDKSPSPASKLLINHGKPNFTIQRSPKIQNGNANPLSPSATKVNNSNEFVVKSTTFNGILKPSSISKTSLQQSDSENEASKVVLRKAVVKPSEPAIKEGEDENVPEFIRRQRRIQERLANQNVDFENRRSGYFTHVMITPTSPNRQSFVQTMASPAIVPSLEIPPPIAAEKQEEDNTEIKQSEEDNTPSKQSEQKQDELAETLVHAAPVAITNGHAEEEEEVAKAIEEVNKAVEGESDEVLEEDHKTEQQQQEKIPAVEESAVAATSSEPQQEVMIEQKATEEVTTEAQEPTAVAVVTSAIIDDAETQEPQQNGHIEAVVTTAALLSEDDAAQMNGNAEELQNGHEITISHTNGLNGPSIPSPDPSAEKGVNFEPKTVVSFSKDLGSEPNKYPDTVKITKEAESTLEASEELKELSKLKFEIKDDGNQDIQVTPVIKTD